jgi:hypothetical protein
VCVAVYESWSHARRELFQARFNPVAPGDQIVSVVVGKPLGVVETAPGVADRIPPRQLERR